MSNIQHSSKFVDIQLSTIYAGELTKHVNFKTRAFALILTALSFPFDPCTDDRESIEIVFCKIELGWSLWQGCYLQLEKQLLGISTFEKMGAG